MAAADVTEVAVRFLLAEIPPRLTGLTRNARAMAKAHEEAAEKRDMIFLPMNESRFRCGEKYLHWFVLGPRLFPSARSGEYYPLLDAAHAMHRLPFDV